jgi:IS30 family transposase
MCYRHLIQEERCQIFAFKGAGWSLGAIAAKLGRGVSTISRELNRNRVVGPYQPQVAGLLAAAEMRKPISWAFREPPSRFLRIRSIMCSGASGEAEDDIQKYASKW